MQPLFEIKIFYSARIFFTKAFWYYQITWLSNK